MRSSTVPPQEAGVITIGAFHAGSACNIIPDEAVLEVSLRATDPDVRATLCRRVEEIARFQAESFGCTARLDWLVGYPVTMNAAPAVELATSVIVDTFGAEAFEPLEHGHHIDGPASVVQRLGSGEDAPVFLAVEVGRLDDALDAVEYRAAAHQDGPKQPLFRLDRVRGHGRCLRHVHAASR